MVVINCVAMVFALLACLLLCMWWLVNEWIRNISGSIISSNYYILFEYRSGIEEVI